MAVLRIDHVQLAMPVGGEATARAFYAGLFGIPEVPKPEHLVDRGGCWFENGPLKLHLGVEVDFAPAQKAHPALVVDDLEIMARRLREAGFPTRQDLPLEGYDRCYVDDPFGNRIELMQKRDADTR